MKRLLLLCTIALATVAATFAQRVNVTLIKQYTDSDTIVLPNKTIEKKMPFLAVAKEKYDFTVKLRNIARRIATDDTNNNVFTVMLQYSGVGISIVIQSQDIFDITNAKFHGDFVVDRRHFIILENDDNKDLLKTYFKKVRGKETVFERAFEKVQQVILPEPTHYNAIYDERKQTVKEKEVIINNIDKLHATREPVTTDPKQGSNDEDIDAFKIDVELFNE